MKKSKKSNSQQRSLYASDDDWKALGDYALGSQAAGLRVVLALNRELTGKCLELEAQIAKLRAEIESEEKKWSEYSTHLWHQINELKRNNREIEM